MNNLKQNWQLIFVILYLFLLVMSLKYINLHTNI